MPHDDDRDLPGWLVSDTPAGGDAVAPAPKDGFDDVSTNATIDGIATRVDDSEDAKPGDEVLTCPARLPRAPESWRLSRTGVYLVKEKSDGVPDLIPISGPLWVQGFTVGPHKQSGIVLAFIDLDGNQNTLAIPRERLHEDAGVLARELAGMGFRINPGSERKLLAYIGAWDVEHRILSASRLGWIESAAGELAFVMPDRVISRNGSHKVVYQPDRYAPTVKTVRASGSLGEWVEHVASVACRYPPMLFALCAGLVPPFLAFAGMDSFVMHFWGQTTRGKTLLVQIAASSWGCAADPANAPSLSFVRRWNVTANGLEGLAEAHSDLPLPLDELGAANVYDVRPLVYQLSGGQGKTAMTSTRALRENKSRRTVAISSGELSLHAKMNDPDGTGKARQVKGGLTHRALDIEVTDIAEASPAAERGAITRTLKEKCACYYGTAGPELVRLICAHFDDLAAVRAHVGERLEKIKDQLTPTGLAVEMERALRRFALIAVAGEFAAQHGLIPATAEDVLSAVRAAAQQWLGSNHGTDEDRIVDSIREFVLRHEARFQPLHPADQEQPVRDRVGFVDHKGGGLWCFTSAGIGEAAPGYDAVTIARALRRAGYLHTNDSKLQANIRVGGRTTRVYAVKGSIIEGATGQAPDHHERHSPTGEIGGARVTGGTDQQQHHREPFHPPNTDRGSGGTGNDPDDEPLHPFPPAKAEGETAGDGANTDPFHELNAFHQEDGDHGPIGEFEADEISACTKEWVEGEI